MKKRSIVEAILGVAGAGAIIGTVVGSKMRGRDNSKCGCFGVYSPKGALKSLYRDIADISDISLSQYSDEQINDIIDKFIELAEFEEGLFGRPAHEEYYIRKMTGVGSWYIKSTLFGYLGLYDDCELDEMSDDELIAAYKDEVMDKSDGALSSIFGSNVTVEDFGGMQEEEPVDTSELSTEQDRDVRKMVIETSLQIKLSLVEDILCNKLGVCGKEELSQMPAHEVIRRFNTACVGFVKENCGK